MLIKKLNLQKKIKIFLENLHLLFKKNDPVKLIYYKNLLIVALSPHTQFGYIWPELLSKNRIL
jgi:hypothetical protein